MTKFFLRLALASVALVPAASALAADLDPPPPPVEELRGSTYDWTGIYIGGWVGATCIEGDLTDITNADDWEMSGCGWKGGALAGYNYQYSNWVVGFEGDWGMSGIIATNEEPTADFAFSMDSIATLRARWGYAFDDTLLFLTGGGAWAKGDLDGIVFTDPDHIKGYHFGWTIGGGIEHAFNESFRVKMDYLYTRFTGDNYYSTNCQAVCDIDVHDFDDHEVRVGAIWAF